MTDHEVRILVILLSSLGITAYAAAAIHRWAEAHPRDVVYLAAAARVERWRARIDGWLDRLEARCVEEAFR